MIFNQQRCNSAAQLFTPNKVFHNLWVVTSPRPTYQRPQTAFSSARNSTQSARNTMSTLRKGSCTAIKERRGSVMTKGEFHEGNYLLTLSPKEKTMIYTQKKKRKEFERIDKFSYAFKNLDRVSKYRVSPITQGKSKDVLLVESILQKYNKKFIEQNKRMKEYHVLWLTNLFNYIDSEKANPDLLNFIRAKIKSEEFRKIFKMDKATNREELYNEFKENLRTVLQKPYSTLSSELRLQIKNILESEVRLSCAPEKLLKKEEEFAKESNSRKNYNEKQCMISEIVRNTEKRINDFKDENNKEMEAQKPSGNSLIQIFRGWWIMCTTRCWRLSLKPSKKMTFKR
jgi:hypothetical protein